MRPRAAAAHLGWVGDQAGSGARVGSRGAVDEVDCGEGESEGCGYAEHGVHGHFGGGIQRREPFLVHHEGQDAGYENEQRKAVDKALGGDRLVGEVDADGDGERQGDQEEAKDDGEDRVDAHLDQGLIHGPRDERAQGKARRLRAEGRMGVTARIYGPSRAPRRPAPLPAGVIRADAPWMRLSPARRPPPSRWEWPGL